VLGTTIAPIEAFCTAETAKAGRTYYHSQIITLKDSGIRTVADLRGHLRLRRPLVDLGHLSEGRPDPRGHRPDKFFGRVLFTGSHDANALAVANKRVDAATIADRIFDAAVAKKLIDPTRCMSSGARARSRNRRRYGGATCRTS
jgi:phosphonate transport system substrate-binding protein